MRFTLELVHKQFSTEFLIPFTSLAPEEIINIDLRNNKSPNDLIMDEIRTEIHELLIAKVELKERGWSSENELRKIDAFYSHA